MIQPAPGQQPVVVVDLWILVLGRSLPQAVAILRALGERGCGGGAPISFCPDARVADSASSAANYRVVCYLDDIDGRWWRAAAVLFVRRSQPRYEHQLKRLLQHLDVRARAQRFFLLGLSLV